MRLNDLTGKRFGRLLVIERSGSSIHKKALWKCICDCGKEVIEVGGNLSSGLTGSCGCYNREMSSLKNGIDLTGKTFGRLTALKRTGKSKHGYNTWECECTCGAIVNINGAYLLNGDTKSCGCLAKDNISNRNKNHNPSQTSEGRQKISKAKLGKPMLPEAKKNHLAAMRSPEVKEKISGKNHPNWHGGISFEPYCPKFNKNLKESIRERFNRTCFLCGAKENGRKLHIHHVDYDKNDICNGKSWPLLPLCGSCHIKTSMHRHYYFNLLINYWCEGWLDGLCLV